MFRIKPLSCVLALSVLAAASSCAAVRADPRMTLASRVIKASLPPEVATAVLARAEKAPGRFLELLEAVDAEASVLPDLLRRVDKATPLPETFVPADLVGLDGSGLSVSRAGHQLRKPAFEALLAMDRAARAAGITLVVGSSYRSYRYQVEVFAREVKASGSEAAADRVVARPGKSQHQLGMAVDFAPIDDAFSGTKAHRWLLANAAAYGFSNSYPPGLEAVTGYDRESWHWRYIGKAACALEAEFFGGVQQYLVEFMEERGRAGK